MALGARPEPESQGWCRVRLRTSASKGLRNSRLRSMRPAFDEMNGGNAATRPAYAELERWLNDIPPDVLNYRRREAELLFRRIGITFAVYGEADAQERLIPFDVFPPVPSPPHCAILPPASDHPRRRRVGHSAGLPRAAREGAQRLHSRRLRTTRDPQGRRGAAGPGVPEPGVPARDERAEGAARHLRPYRRHRYRAGRSRNLLCARG